MLSMEVFVKIMKREFPEAEFELADLVGAYRVFTQLEKKEEIDKAWKIARDKHEGIYLGSEVMMKRTVKSVTNHNHILEKGQSYIVKSRIGPGRYNLGTMDGKHAGSTNRENFDITR